MDAEDSAGMALPVSSVAKKTIYRMSLVPGFAFKTLMQVIDLNHVWKDNRGQT